MMSSIDGRLNPSRWGPPVGEDTARMRAQYNAVYDRLGADGWIVGRVTMDEMANGGREAMEARGHASFAPCEDERPAFVPRSHHVADRKGRSLAVAMDPHGRVRYAGEAIAGDHVVAALGEKVPDEYLAELRERGVSYVFSGPDGHDIGQMLDTLAEVFDARSLVLQGGARINGAFLQAGLIDEYSILIFPAVDGLSTEPSIVEVDGAPGERPSAGQTLRLIGAETLEGGSCGSGTKPSSRSRPRSLHRTWTRDDDDPSDRGRAGPSSRPGRAPAAQRRLLVSFLVISLALPVLPLHVHDELGFGPVVVGLVTGCQFAAALLARVWAGRIADARGAKWAVVAGLFGAALAGLLYLGSVAFLRSPGVSVAVLLTGRSLLGAAESFIITGATAWGLARAGARNAGKVIAWMGTATFAGFAAGAPLGTLLYGSGGFASVAAATALAPLLALAVVWPVRSTVMAAGLRPSILSVIGRIWLPGAGAALSSIGFGAILGFGSLLFVEHLWTPIWLPFSSYALALIVARLAFGHLPDRLGGAKVAIGFVFVEAAGLATMSLAASAGVAAFGAALTGFGYSLVFPGLGVEAVRLAPPESRGVAMGAYTACLDLALGVASPGLGLVAGEAGYSAAFAVGAFVVLGSALVSMPLVTHPAASTLTA